MNINMKIFMVRTPYITTLLGIIVLCTSCTNNEIYFDLSNQSVNTCNGHSISFLSVTKTDYKEYGSYSTLQGQDGTARFKIHTANPGCVFESDTSPGVEVFSFEPNSQYLIENHSNGDAASSEIKVTTDSKGMVVSGSKTDCP